jgi:ATP-dependent RNA circularization protein (DNA/RNA ligase family)
MNEYHKINSIFMRDMDKPGSPFIAGKYAAAEIEYLKNNQWEWTEKVDGTNIRIMYVGGAVSFGGKTDRAEIPAHLLKRLTEIFNNDNMKQAFGETDVCLYGEGFGYKIQGKVGIDYLKDKVDFYLFDIKIGNWWLKREDVAGIAEKLGLLAPVVVGYGTIDEAIEVVKRGFKSAFGTADAEGLVLRPTVELLSRGGERIITKVKARDFKEVQP